MLCICTIATQMRKKLRVRIYICIHSAIFYFIVNFVNTAFFLTKMNFFKSIFVEGHISTSIPLRAIMQCHISINNILGNKYFISLSLESIKQHYD